MRQRYPRRRCTFDQGLFDDPPLLLDWAVLPLGSGSALAFDCDEFCGLRGSVHLRSKWTRSICVSTKNKDVLLSHLCPDGYQRTLTSFRGAMRYIRTKNPATIRSRDVSHIPRVETKSA